jgi:anthranilate phosphoribosyltransferase
MNDLNLPEALAWLHKTDALNRFLDTQENDTVMLERLTSLHPDHLNTEALRLLHTAIWQRQVTDFQTFSQKPEILLDTCGTGGSGISSFNTSTTVAFVLASLGVPVLKFGNRAATSASGSFDFLEALGVPTPLKNEAVLPLFEETGLSFLMAPQVYPSLAKLAPFRKQVKHPTAFNFLGPLLNPTRPTHRVLGCSYASLMLPLGELLESPDLVNVYSLVLRASNGLDEAHPQVMTKGLYIGKRRPLMLELPPFLGASDVVDDTSTTALDLSATANVHRFFEMIEGRDVSSLAYWQVVLNAGLAWQLVHPHESLASATAVVKDALASGVVHRFFKDFSQALHRCKG